MGKAQELPVTGTLADIAITMCKRHRHLIWDQIDSLVRREMQDRMGDIRDAFERAVNDRICLGASEATGRRDRALREAMREQRRRSAKIASATVGAIRERHERVYGRRGAR